MTKLQKLHSKKGFTLIELIIVIVIIAILAAIAIPSIIGFTKDAEKATAQANARTLYTAAAAAGAVYPPAGIPGKLVTSLTKTGFEGKVAELLGKGFGGTVTVAITADGTIESVTWKSAKNVSATYLPATGGFADVTTTTTK